MAGLVEEFLRWTRTVERITRPPRRPFVDTDDLVDGAEQLAEKEAEEEVYEPSGSYHDLLSLDNYDDVPSIPEPDLTPDELVAVRGLIQERYDAKTVPPHLAHRAAAAAMIFPQHSNSSAATDEPSAAVSSAPRLADDSGEAGRPPVPASPHLAVWLQPAVWTALTPHEPHRFNYVIACCGDTFGDWQEWREHVGAPLAAHIAQALPDFPGDLPGLK